MNHLALGLLVAVVLAALANWHSRHHSMAKLEAITKPLTTVAVIALAAALDTAYPGSRRLVVAALVLCLIGDVLLMPIVDNFVGGLGAFLVGHLLFGVAALVRPVDRCHWAWAAVAVVALGAVAWLFGRQIVTFARGKDRRMGVAVSAYLGVISLMAVVVVLRGGAISIAGAAFFVASDTLLGYDLFVRPMRLAKVGIMVTYHLALVGLTLGLVWR